MASSTPELAKEMGKYSGLTEFSSGRPHEKSRVLAAEDVDGIKKCAGAGCGKNMSEVKDSRVCSCKLAIHCSKACFKSSNHKCEEPYVGKNVGFAELMKAGNRYLVDRNANKGPSSEKVKQLLVNTTKGDRHMILRYANRRIPLAAYLVGIAYMEREFDRKAPFAIPPEYKEKSVAETNEIAIKWLKVAAEAGVPEAMFCLFWVMVSEGGLQVDRRVAHCWLDKAYATGDMDYLLKLLQTPMDGNLPQLFNQLFDDITKSSTKSCKLVLLMRVSVAQLLMAIRFRELEAWDGKTAMGKPFYAFPIFKSVMELIGGFKNEQSGPSFIEGEKKTLLVISARLGYTDFVDKSESPKREENNLTFLQGVKEKVNPDYQLAGQTSNVDGRTNYLISCKHNKVNLEEGFVAVRNKSLDEIKNEFKSAGKCEPCVQEASHRLRAVRLGEFSISLKPVLGEIIYAARYAKEEGVIVQDLFWGFKKLDIKQSIQCLMSNPADLHPLAIAEEADLFWPIIWFWGSVYGAVQDSCDKATLDAIYRSLGGKKSFAKSKNPSALAAFPEAAAGEWRIACGNEDCVKVDHEVKFNVCRGCKVRRYCNEACQKKDWEKHMKFCNERLEKDWEKHMKFCNEACQEKDWKKHMKFCKAGKKQQK